VSRAEGVHRRRRPLSHPAVAPGDNTLNVSTAGYRLEKAFRLESGETKEFDAVLSPDTPPRRHRSRAGRTAPRR